MQIKDLTTAFSYVTTDVMPWCSATGVDSKVSYGDLRTAISNYCITQNPVPNNNRIFYATFMIDDASAVAGTMTNGATFYTGNMTLATGNIILRNASTDKVNNGLWVVQATGAAIRYDKANTALTLGRSYTVIRYAGGTSFAGNIYYCTNPEPNVGTDAIDFEQRYFQNQSLNTTDSPTFNALTTTGLATLDNAKIGDVAGGNYTEISDGGNIIRHGSAYIKRSPCALYKQITDVTIANTVTETSLLSGAAGTRTLPANCLSVGDYMIIEAMGTMSTLNNSQTGQVKLLFNSTDLLGSSQLTLGNAALNNDLYVNRFLIKVVSTGVTGSVRCLGYTMIHNGTGISAPIMREVNPTVVTIDTTVDIVVDVTYTWGSANASNSITMVMGDFDIVKV